MSSSLPFNPELKDESRADQLITVVTVFTAFLVITTSLRIGTKLWIHLQLGADDYFAMFSCLLNVVASAFEYVAISAGFGRHLQFLSEHDKRKYHLASQFGVFFATIAQWAARMSLCFFILRLIKGTHKRLRRSVYGLMIFTSACNSATVILWFTQAAPIRKLWDTNVPGTYASKRQLINSMIANTVIYVIIDLTYALSPLYFLHSLQVSRHKRMTISILTGSGLLVVAPSIARAVYAVDFMNPDSSWAYVNEFISSIVERNMVTIVANLPVFPPLWHNVRLKASALADTLSKGELPIRDGAQPDRSKRLASSEVACESQGEESDGPPKVDLSLVESADVIVVQRDFEVERVPRGIDSGDEKGPKGI